MDMKDEFEGTANGLAPNPIAKRPLYWQVSSWERSILASDPKRRLYFPPHDLLQSLVHLYFRRVNVFFPLFHIPTFWRRLEENEHLKDYWFGRNVLLVCALGSRYSDDPRVTVDPENPDTLTAGHKWFEQGKLPVLLVQWAPANGLVSASHADTLLV